VLLQEVQQHRDHGHILHADFHEISMTEKLRIKIPVQVRGRARGRDAARRRYGSR